jgi:hypothetical protein
VHYALALEDRLLADLVAFALNDDPRLVAVGLDDDPDVVIRLATDGGQTRLVISPGTADDVSVSIALDDHGPAALVASVLRLVAITEPDHPTS